METEKSHNIIFDEMLFLSKLMNSLNNAMPMGQRTTNLTIYVKCPEKFLSLFGVLCKDM